MYQALYRKWRPNVFEDVLGQSHITDTLKSQIVNHKLSHAYLFSGSRGTGKTSTAKILSRAVNCENPINGNPCNRCHACQTALSGSAVDIIEIDAASNNRVDDVRIIREEVAYTPADLKYKVYIIDEAHMLTDAAFNAFLKTLEEPPAHVIFIFATTEPHKFPATVLSRCQRFDFKRITPYDTEKRIRQIVGQDGYAISDEAVGLLAQIADGSMRDALSILDQCLSSGITDIGLSDIARITGTSDPNFIYEFSQQIVDGDLSSCFLSVKTAYENGRDMERILEELITHFRGVLIAKTLDDSNQLKEILSMTASALRVYEAQAKEISSERLLRYLDILSEAIASQKYIHNPRLCVEVAVTAMMKRPSLSDFSGLSERLQELENKVNRLSVTLGTATVNTQIADTAEISHEEDESLGKTPEGGTTMIPHDPIPDTMDDSSAEDAAGSFGSKQDSLTEEVEAEFAGNTSTGIQQEQKPTLPKPVDGTNTSTDAQQESTADGLISSVWDAVMETAARSADFGFRRILTDCRLAEQGMGVDVFIVNESFLSIARINQYDKIIAQAIVTVTGKEYTVKLRCQEQSSEEGDSFRQLLDRLDGFSENIHFK